MDDSFFDGALDDFYYDLELLRSVRQFWDLPLNSSSQSGLVPVPTTHSNHSQLRTSQNATSQRDFVDRHASSSVGEEAREASAPPYQSIGTEPDPRPTRAASNRPTATSSRRPDRLHAPTRTLSAPDRDLFQLNFPPGRTSNRPAISVTSTTSSPSRSAVPSTSPIHVLTNPSTIPNTQQGHSDSFPSVTRLSRNSGAIPQRPTHQHQRDSTSRAVDLVANLATQSSHRRQTSTHDSSQQSPSLPGMSANTRRSLRANDLTLPSTPIQAAQSSQQPTPRSPQTEQPQPNQSATKRKREPDFDDDDLFGDSACPDIVDLVDKTEVPPDGSNSQEDRKNYVKLSSFDCVICMDSVKDLTVTHCGHLFCSACLHSALNMDQSRRICPICRQKIDRQPITGARFSQKAKGFYPLELKLMTRKTIGVKHEQSAGRDGTSSR